MRFLKSKLILLALIAGLTLPSSGCTACSQRDWEDAGDAVGQAALVVLVVALEIGLCWCGGGGHGGGGCHR